MGFKKFHSGTVIVSIPFRDVIIDLKTILLGWGGFLMDPENLFSHQNFIFEFKNVLQSQEKFLKNYIFTTVWQGKISLIIYWVIFTIRLWIKRLFMVFYWKSPIQVTMKRLCLTSSNLWSKLGVYTLNSTTHSSPIKLRPQIFSAFDTWVIKNYQWSGHSPLLASPPPHKILDLQPYHMQGSTLNPSFSVFLNITLNRLTLTEHKELGFEWLGK